MRDHTAIYHGVDYHNNNIYVGGTSNFNYSDPFFSTSDSWFHLIKINPDISPIWEYWYGGDAYYVLYSILATSDGGCLMVGNRFDDELQDQERDIYVAKVNDEGLILWTQEIRPDKPLSYVYPNTGTDYCNINSSIGELQIHFHNFSGQLLSSSRLHEGNNLINTIVWPAGIYLYRIYDSKQQLIQSGKWIKTF